MIQPIDMKIKTVKEDEYRGVYEFEPLPKGYGYTVGNVLRRVLLTSVEGSAITQISIKGVEHQFSTLEGVKEDIVEMTLNLKELRFINHSEEAVVATLNVSKKGVVTGADIECPSDLEVVNKDLEIATLTKKDVSLEIDILVGNGYGYSPSEERQSNKVGVIILDALYSPVLKTSYEVSSTRFGKSIDLDKLTLDITTDGTISPKDALIEGSKTIKAFFERLVIWDDIEGVTEEDLEEVASAEGLVKEKILVEDLPLPTRTLNALRKAGITTLQELAEKSEDELLDIKNLGEKSMEEINKLLEKENL